MDDNTVPYADLLAELLEDLMEEYSGEPDWGIAADIVATLGELNCTNGLSDEWSTTLERAERLIQSFDLRKVAEDIPSRLWVVLSYTDELHEAMTNPVCAESALTEVICATDDLLDSRRRLAFLVAELAIRDMFVCEHIHEELRQIDKKIHNLMGSV